MGIPDRASDSKVPRLDLELNHGCDHACGHCYNVWNASDDDPQGGYEKGQLPTAEYLTMVEAVIADSGADMVTVTGGEPLLRRDAMAIIGRVCELVSTVQLITNGSHVDDAVASQLASFGVRSVQLTLLSTDREKHDRLKGAACFDDTLRAAAALAVAKVPVQICFVATRDNAEDFEAVMELGFALGVRSIAYNRMSPAGWAVHEVERLLPTVEQVEANLDTAERLGPKYGIEVSTAMPIPPCLIRIERYEWVRFGFCSVGTKSPNITVDPLGNVRSCNLSSHVMGNLKQDDWRSIHGDRYFHEFRRQVPEMCRGCHYEASCQGGCKESGFATFGDLRHPEPFVNAALSRVEEHCASSSTAPPLPSRPAGRARLRVVG